PTRSAAALQQVAEELTALLLKAALAGGPSIHVRAEGGGGEAGGGVGALLLDGHDGASVIMASVVVEKIHPSIDPGVARQIGVLGQLLRREFFESAAFLQNHHADHAEHAASSLNSHHAWVDADVEHLFWPHAGDGKFVR